MKTEEEIEAFRAVDLACVRLANTSHRSTEVLALRVDVERAIANLKRVLGSPQPVRYTLRASGFSEGRAR